MHPSPHIFTSQNCSCHQTLPHRSSSDVDSRISLWINISGHLLNRLLKTMHKTNRVRSKKLDKDWVFTSKWNPMRVSEMIYSINLILLAIQTLFWDRHMIPQTVLTLLRDRHTISVKQPPMLLKSTHDLTMNLNALIPIVAHRCNNQWEIPSNRERYTREVLKRQEQLNKSENQIEYLTRFGNLPTFSGQGRKILLIQ